MVWTCNLHTILVFWLALFSGGCRDYTVLVEAEPVWDASGVWTSVNSTQGRSLELVIVGQGGEGYYFDGQAGHDLKPLRVVTEYEQIRVSWPAGELEGELKGKAIRGRLLFDGSLYDIVLERASDVF